VYDNTTEEVGAVGGAVAWFLVLAANAVADQTVARAVKSF
jgi:hypothetical protein